MVTAAWPAPAPPPPQQQQQQHAAEASEQEEGSDGEGSGEGDWKEERCCSHCGDAIAKSSRRHPTTGQRLCNACGSFARRNGGALPSQEQLEQRQRTRQARAALGQRRCQGCGADSPGTSKSAHWRRHPETKAAWYCQPCYAAAYNGLHPNRPSKTNKRPAAMSDSSSSGESEGDEPPPQQPQAASGPAVASKGRTRNARPQRPLAESEASSGEEDEAPPPAKRRRPPPPRSSGGRPGQQQARLKPSAVAGKPLPPRQQQQQQPAALPAQQPLPTHAPPPDLLPLLQAAMALPAAAAAGLTPELAAASVALLPLEAGKV